MLIHKKAKQFHKKCTEEFQFNSEELEILSAVIDQLSMYWIASDQLSKDGLTTHQDGGIVRQHPAVAITKNCWQGFLAGCRLLQIGGKNEIQKK